MPETTNPFEEDVTPPASAGSGIDLSTFDEEYAAAEAEETDRVPDGKYQVRIEKVSLATTREKNIPMIKWQLGVISGPQAKRKIFKNSVITKDSLRFVKGDLEKLGLKLDKLSGLESRLASVLDKTVEVTVATKSKDGGAEFSNVYFNRVLTIPAGDTGADPIPW